MKSINFIEEENQQVDFFAKKGLGTSIHDTKELLDNLVESGLVKKGKRKRSVEKADETIYDEDFIDVNGYDIVYKFVYVGIIEINGYIIKCYPKFIRKPNPQPSDLRLILQAIEHYSTAYGNLDTSVVSSPECRPNQLGLALLLLRNYFTYGIYTNQYEELTLLGQGEIDWNATINTTVPVIRDNRPYYFDYYTRDTRQDDTDYISRLHACIITECSTRLCECELDEILQLETPILYHGERIDFGTNDYICQRLYKELNIQFVSQKQALLRNLLTWVENAKVSADSPDIQLFGTSSFHVLWEKMCAFVFESQYPETQLHSLGIPLIGNYHNLANKTLESLIPHPKWRAIESEANDSHYAETIKPDYVRIIKTNSTTFFVILDAKYYNIVLDNVHVANYPGVEDINKQYLYHLAYKQFINAHDLHSINAFICPTDEDRSYVIGTVQMPIFDGLGLSDIKVLKIDAKRVMNHYINGTPLSLPEEIPELFTVVHNYII